MKKKNRLIACIIVISFLCCIRIMQEIKEPRLIEIQKNLVQDELEEKPEENVQVEPKEIVESVEKTNNYDEIFLEFGIVNKLTGKYDSLDDETAEEFVNSQEVVSILEIGDTMYKVVDMDDKSYYLKKEDVSLKPIVMFANTDTPVYDENGDFINILIKQTSDVKVVGKIKDKYKVIIDGKEGYVYKDMLKNKEVKVEKGVE